MDKLIVQHPELTKLYPAIDGIAKDRREGHYAEDPIRSDILEILSFDQAKFDAWHKNRYEAIKKHLNEWTVMGDVPDPRYGGRIVSLLSGDQTLFREAL